MNLFYRAIRNKNFWWLKSADISSNDVTDTLLPQAGILKAGSWCCYTAASGISHVLQNVLPSTSANEMTVTQADTLDNKWCLPAWHFLLAKWTTVNRVQKVTITSLKLLLWLLLSVIWFPTSCVIYAHYSENYSLTCDETPRELAIFCWLGRIYGFIYSRDVPSFSNAEALSELWPWGEWNAIINHWHQWEILHGHHVPLSIDHRTAVDLEWRKVKDKGHLYFIYITEVLKMACHESMKDLLHKTLGLNDTDFPHRLSDY